MGICKFYPCHEGENHECSFCWCPIYPCEEGITGGYWYEANGIKVWDCSNCCYVHNKRFTDMLNFRWSEIWTFGGFKEMYVIKRDGSKVEYTRSKVTNAIYKSANSISHEDPKHTTQEMADKLAYEVEELIIKKFEDRLPSVEDVQDLVELVLMNNSLADIAKNYILYREDRTKLRKEKARMGIVDELKLSIPCCNTLKKRYLLKNINEEIIESTGELFRRVAKAVGSATKEKGLPKTPEFYEIMVSQKFFPNSPTLMNAGTEQGCLSACFVLPVGDTMQDIMMAGYWSAMIQKFGGGVGMSFSRLRGSGDHISTTHGKACGPIKVLKQMSSISYMVTQGGKRESANMGILRIDHPDIEEFIICKKNDESLSNFNLSVAITDKFMKAAAEGKDFDLISPKDGSVIKTVKANILFEQIVENAWKRGDPGIVFIDEMNRKHQVKGEIESTNPCGEQPLLPYESCNLGSINIEKFVVDGKFDWKEFKRVIGIAVVFLDNVITINKFPTVELDGHKVNSIQEETLKNRKIGLGIMGLANTLIRLGLRYDTEEARRFAGKIMKTLTHTARSKSSELGKIRGNFPNFRNRTKFKKLKHLRNATVTTIAPTGSICMIADTSSSIEPLFAVSYKRTTGWDSWYETSPLFEEMLKKYRIHNEEILQKVSGVSSIQNIAELPKEIRDVFVTACDISPEDHIKMQSVIQKYTDNAVSKTVLLPNYATRDDVAIAYISAHRAKCKGVTVYRDGSLSNQPLQTENKQVENPFSASKCDITGKECS